MGREVPAAFGSAGIPPQVGPALASAGGGAGIQALTGVGNAGAALLASLPADVRAVVEPFVPAIVSAIHQVFSIPTASTFAVGIGTSVLAAGLVLLLREVPATAAAAAGAAAWEPADSAIAEETVPAA